MVTPRVYVPSATPVTTSSGVLTWLAPFFLSAA